MTETRSELRDIRLMLEKIESIIDSRLLGIVEPEQDETAAIRDYEKRKASGSLELHEL